MIEMMYSNKRIAPIILNSGIYKKHKFIVLNLETHPTAYVECKLDNVIDYYDSRLGDIDVHWGLTYFGIDYWNNNHDGNKYIGWDYAHSGDWTGYETNEINERLINIKHNTEEITNECYNAINQLIKIESVDNKNIDIVQEIGIEAMLGQLAEECCELGKAALKLQRIYMGKNPTPVTVEQVLNNLQEEANDVTDCLVLLHDAGYRVDNIEQTEKKEAKQCLEINQEEFENWKNGFGI